MGEREIPAGSARSAGACASERSAALRIDLPSHASICWLRCCFTWQTVQVGREVGRDRKTRGLDRRRKEDEGLAGGERTKGRQLGTIDSWERQGEGHVARRQPAGLLAAAHDVLL